MLNTEQVETLLKSQDPSEQPPKSSTDGSQPNFTISSQPPMYSGLGATATAGASMGNLEVPQMMSPLGGSPQDLGPDAFSFDETMMATDGGMVGEGNSFPWELIGLGLEEPLPPQDTIEDL